MNSLSKLWAISVGAFFGFLLLLPLFGLAKLLPKKLSEHDLTPIFVSVFAGSIGMYFVIENTNLISCFHF